MKRHKIFSRRGRYLHGIWLAGRPRTTIFYNGIRALEKCWSKRISDAGVYVEK